MKSMLSRRRIMLGLASSPFSPEATAILKEDFPDEWNDIKRYGYAHPEMVPYINEDPYLVVSLGLVDGVERWLVGDGTAYIKTNINSVDLQYVEIKASKVIYNNEVEAFIGVKTGNYPSINLRQNKIQSIFINYYINYEFTDNYNTHIYKSDFNNNNLYIDNISVGVLTPVTKSFESGDLMIFKTHGDDIDEANKYAPLEGNIAYVKYIKNNENNIFYPFIHNNSNGMINTLTGTFYPNSNSTGVFTIEFEGRPYLNITSTTKTYIINTYGENAWNTVKEFFTNPDNEYLVKYVNEDPDIVCSLVDIGTVRYVSTDGIAYAQTTIKLQDNDILTVKGYFEDNSNTGILDTIVGCNSVNSWTNGNLFIVSQFDMGSSTQNYKQIIIGSYNATTQGLYKDFNSQESFIAKIDFKNKKKYVNGNQITTSANFSGINMTTMFTSISGLAIFRFNRGGTLDNKSGIAGKRVYYLTIERNGNIVVNLVPYKQGFLDLVTETYYPNSSESGTFTISTEQNS